MAAARPLPDDLAPDDAAEELRKQRLVRELSRNVGRFLLEAARAHPGIWEQRTHEPGPRREPRSKEQP